MCSEHVPTERCSEHVWTLNTSYWKPFLSHVSVHFCILMHFTSRTRLGSPPNFAKTRFGRSPTFHSSTNKFLFETSNGRLPPEDGSDRLQTLGKRVSGDPRHCIFRRPQTFLAATFFVGKIFRQQPEFFFSKVPVLEELCRFTHLYRMQIENSLPDI